MQDKLAEKLSVFLDLFFLYLSLLEVLLILFRICTVCIGSKLLDLIVFYGNCLLCISSFSLQCRSEARLLLFLCKKLHILQLLIKKFLIFAKFVFFSIIAKNFVRYNLIKICPERFFAYGKQSFCYYKTLVFCFTVGLNSCREGNKQYRILPYLCKSKTAVVEFLKKRCTISSFDQWLDLQRCTGILLFQY